MKKFYLFILVSFFTFLSSHVWSANHIITVADFSFSPDTMTVATGDTITWTWQSGFHTTTANGIPDGAAQWNEIIDSLHQSFSYVVSVPGTYNYISVPDLPAMTGKFTLPGIVGIDPLAAPAFTMTLFSNTGSNEVIINCSLMNDAPVDIGLYNVSGIRLQTIIHQNLAAGNHVYNLYPDEALPAGMYFIRMQAGAAFIGRKLMIQ